MMLNIKNTRRLLGVSIMDGHLFMVTCLGLSPEASGAYTL